MRAAQEGDGRAYEQLLHEISPFVRALARRHCRNQADVEEIVQETLLSVHRVRHTYDPARPFSPRLAAIASRRIIDSLRRRLKVARHEAITDFRSINLPQRVPCRSSVSDDSALPASCVAPGESRLGHRRLEE